MWPMALSPHDIFHGRMALHFSANFTKLVCVDAAPSELFAFSPGPGFSRLPLSLSLCDWKWMRDARQRPRPPSSFVCFVLLGKSLTFGQDLFARKTTPGATDRPTAQRWTPRRGPRGLRTRTNGEWARKVLFRWSIGERKFVRGGDAAHL